MSTLVQIIAVYAGLAICVGIVLGAIAGKNGGSFVKWFLYGALLPLVALPHAIIIIMASDTKQCMYCHKKVKYSATHCPRCGFEFIDLS